MDRTNFIIQFIQNGGWIIFLVVLWRLLKSNKASKTDEDFVEKKKSSEKEDVKMFNKSKKLDFETRPKIAENTFKKSNKINFLKTFKSIIISLKPFFTNSILYFFLFLINSVSLNILLNIRPGKNGSALYNFRNITKDFFNEDVWIFIEEINKVISIEAMLLSSIVLIIYKLYFKYSLKKIFNYSILFFLIVLIIYFAFDEEVVKQKRRL